MLEKEVQIPEFQDKRGSLYVMNFNDLPFIPQRIFYIMDVPTFEERGNHAHRTCHQLIVALNGSVDIELVNSRGNSYHSLSKPKMGLHIPPLNWGIQKNFQDGTVLLVLASEPYNKDEYIFEIEEFNELLKDIRNQK